MSSDCFVAKGGPEWVHERWALLIAKRVRALSIDRKWVGALRADFLFHQLFRFYGIFKVVLLEENYEKATPGDLLERFKSGGQ